MAPPVAMALKNKGPFQKLKIALFAHELYCLPVDGTELGHCITLSSKDEHKKYLN